MSRAGRALAALWVATGILVGATAALDRPFGYFSRDPASELDAPVYVGYLAHLSVLGWWTGAAVACFAAALGRGRRAARMLGAAGLFTAVLALDDLFELHERVVPEATGVPQEAVVAVYAVAALAWVAAFRAELRASAWPLAAVAAVLFAVSVGADLAFEDASRAYEDGAKLFGIVTWAVYLADTAAALVTPAPAASGRGSRPARSPGP